MKIYLYKLLLGILLTGVFSFSLGFTLSHVGIISNAVFGVPLLPYASLGAEVAKAILTIISAFYIANKIINFRILGIDCKLNFIFFIAFSTIGVIIVSFLSLFLIFGMISYGRNLIRHLRRCAYPSDRFGPPGYFISVNTSLGLSCKIAAPKGNIT